MHIQEAQAAHWTREHVTIHPVVAYFHCPEDNEVCRESFIILSSDLTHDAQAVKHFIHLVLDILLERNIPISRVIEFSDGCAGQYKGKTGFVDLTLSAAESGIPMERHFFGSRHGKSVCDGEIGVVKRSASLAVKGGRAVIATAEDLYEYCQQNLTLPLDDKHLHSRRSFIFVKRGDISRPPNCADIRSVPGTRSLHCVASVTSFVLSTRERSCFCDTCNGVSKGQCPNTRVCGPWKVVTLKKMTRPQLRNRTGKYENYL